MKRFTWFNATSLAFGFAFLYLPILLLVIYSFNESKLVTVWARLLDQMVRRTAAQLAPCWMPPGSRCALPC